MVTSNSAAMAGFLAVLNHAQRLAHHWRQAQQHMTPAEVAQGRAMLTSWGVDVERLKASGQAVESICDAHVDALAADAVSV